LVRAWRTLPVCLLAASAAGAAAQGGGYPAGEVRTEVWSAPTQGREGVRASGRVELDESIGLSGFAARARPADSGSAYGRLDLGDFRVAGGTVGEDSAVHLGYAPAGVLRLHRAVAVAAALDAAVGVGFLGAARSPGGDRAGYPDPIDLYAGSLATRLELRLSPFERVRLRLGATVDLTAVTAPADPAEEVPPGLGGVADATHVGLSTALSRGAVGGYGLVDLRLLRWEALGGRGALHLRYRESWDWIHRDAAYALLRYDADPDLLGYRVGAVPWRVTRTVSLGVVQAGGAGRDAVSLALEGRHVRGSTTGLDVARRDGFSLGVRVGARVGRVTGAVTARYHLDDDPEVERYLGELAHYEVSARFGVELVRTETLAVQAEAGLELALADAFGLPREGHAVSAGLAVSFGGARRAPAVPDAFAAPAVPAGAAAGSAGPSRAAAELGRASGTAGPGRDDLGTELVALGRELGVDGPEAEALAGVLLDEAARRGIPDAAAVDDALARSGALVRRIEALVPGITARARELLERARARRRAPPPRALVAGYGPAGIRLSLVTPGAATARAPARIHAVTARFDRRSLDAVTARADPDAPFGLSFERHPTVLGLAEARRIEKLTVVAAEGDELRPVFQGESAWSRAVHFLLTGRR